MSEQLGFEQRFRNRRAIDRHERLVGARTRVVNAARKELLARSRLADEQHRRASRGGHARGELDGVAQQRTLADDGLKAKRWFGCGCVGNADFGGGQPDLVDG